MSYQLFRAGSSRRLSVLAAAIAAFGLGSAAQATPVPAVPFADGKVLDVQAVVGTGKFASYLVVDFHNTPETDVAFQYNSNTSVPALQMMNAIVAAEAGAFTYTVQSFSFGDEVTSFQYRGTTEVNGDFVTNDNFWNLYTGTVADVSAATPPGSGLTSSNVGISDVTTYDGANDGTTQVIGWIYTDDSTPPALPETAVPEPATVGVLVAGAAGVLARRRRRRA